MKLTEPQDSSARIKQSFDQDWYDACYRRQKFAFGHKWDENDAGSSGSADFPMYSDITSRYHETGIGRNIATAQFLAAAAVCYAEPEPEFPQLEAHDAKVRKAWLKARRSGVPDWSEEDNWKAKPSSGWAQEDICAVMDGDGLGIGFLEIGLEDGESGKQRLSARHSPILSTVGDRTQRNPAKWRHVTFIDYVSEEEAIATYGTDVKAQTTNFYDTSSDRPMRVVPIIRHYDLGYGSGNPTYTLWAGPHTGTPIERIENVFGVLPFSWYVNVFNSGMRYPTGRIEQQMPLENFINEIQREIQAVFRGGAGFDILNEEVMHPEDLKALREGKSIPFVRLIKGLTLDEKAFTRIDTRNIPQEYFQLLEYFKREETMASGVTEFQRGIQMDTGRTATEVNAVAQESGTPAAWASKRLAEYYVRTFEVCCALAKFDKAPVLLDIDGAQIPFNIPSEPFSSVWEYCKKRSQILVNEQTLRYKDQQNEQAREAAKWLGLVQAAPALGIDPAYIRDKVLAAMGEKDPSRAYAQTAQQMPGLIPAPIPA